MASQPDGWVWPGAPLFMRVIPAAGVCYRCGRAGGCNCAAQGSALPRLYTEAEVAALVAEARNKALDEAAAVVEREASDEWPLDDANRYAAAALRSAAAAIRALKEGGG